MPAVLQTGTAYEKSCPSQHSSQHRHHLLSFMHFIIHDFFHFVKLFCEISIFNVFKVFFTTNTKNIDKIELDV